MEQGILATWTAHPAKRRPRDVALVVAVVAMTAGAVLASFQSLFLMVLSVVIICVAISPFLLPTRYVITEHEVQYFRAFSRRSRRFADLRRLEVGPRMALVSPFARPTWLDRYRGLILFLDGADREQVIGLLRQRVLAK